jgi:CRISPR/Cas system-associated exonuclease Cas4 (RecB family)
MTTYALTPTQERLLALMRRDPEPLVFDTSVVDDIVATATDAIAHLSARLGGEPLFVSKGWLSKVHGCEVSHLAPDDFAWTTSNASGFVAHKAIELALNWRGDPAPSEAVDEALARLADQADHRGSFVASLTLADLAELRSRAVDRTTKFLQDFPPLPPSSHPVLETSARWKPDGTIECSGKADLVVGRPNGQESRLLIIDLKSGGKSPNHRADLRFYALLQTLRHRVPPRKLVTYYLDYAEADVEDVTEGALRSALIRTLEGIERHIELHVDRRTPVKRVGRACRWCPLLDECNEGAAFLRGDDPEAVADDE